jgi:hypothetical protein
MKARSTALAERSLNSVLSAIEIYNKPHFADREQVFVVLLTICWETLLKARILSQNKNKLTSIYVKDGSRYKKSRPPKRAWPLSVYTQDHPELLFLMLAQHRLRRVHANVRRLFLPVRCYPDERIAKVNCSEWRT